MSQTNHTQGSHGNIAGKGGSTVGYSSNQTPGAVTNRGQVNSDNQGGGSGSNNRNFLL